MKDFLLYLALMVFVNAVYWLGIYIGTTSAYSDFYHGKVECVQVFEDIECRLKPEVRNEKETD